MFFLLSRYKFFNKYFKNVIFLFISNTIINLNFLLKYWLLNELIWQEGLLLDFLQKKICDNWIKKFVIISSYLFNEKLVFEKIIKFFLNLVLFPLQTFFLFELNNISSLFYFIFILFFFIFYIIFGFLVFLWMF